MLSIIFQLLEKLHLEKCHEVLGNPLFQAAAGLGVLSTALLSYSLWDKKKELKEDNDDGFVYIPTMRDRVNCVRKVPMQSILVAYFAERKDSELYRKYQLALRKMEPLDNTERSPSYLEIEEAVLTELGLPEDKTYPEALKDTDKNAEKIVEWCLSPKASSPSI